jgi:hypothetical protein
MSKKNDYSSLEGQIGDLGAEVTPVASTTSQDLGKINRPEIFGGKPELTPEEKEELNKFIERNRNKSKVEESNIFEGWIPLDREELGKRSIFYPEDWEFSIRPATVQAIKNWTSVDEENPEELNKVFNEIIRLCVRIVDGKGTVHTWQEVNSWDRFWLILKVREYTFVHGESKIEYTDQCENCDEELTFILDSASLTYEFPDDDLMKYWDGNKWVIDPREYDVDADPITLWTPKLGKDQAIIDWAIARARQGKRDIDENFIKFLVWMISKPSRDAANFDSQVRQAQNIYKGWSIDMNSFMNDVVRNITINPSEKLSAKCPHCGAEVTSQVQFPNGVRALFKTESKVKKFGSR